MFHSIKLIITLAFIVLSIQTKSQNSRRDPRKSATCYSNQERISFGSTAFRGFEIRSGKLWAWGNNELGQLGDGTYTLRSSPVPIGNDSNWLMIRPGYWHTLGLKSDGTLWAWGYNNAGVFGNGTYGNSLIPIQIGSDNDWINISAGTSFSLGLKSNGTLWAWGINNVGQLGNGYTQPSSSPFQIGKDDKWVSAMAGRDFGYGLKSDGTLWAWGSNSYGQLGDGSTTNRNTPVQIGKDNDWVSVRAGFAYGVGLKGDGTLWAWGDNISGQCGDGTNTNRSSPVQCGKDNKWVNFTASSYTTLAIRADGSLWAWGNNKYGMIGNGTYKDENTPVKSGNDYDWVGLGTGNSISYAIKSNGSLWSCGNNAHGALGDGTTNNYRNQWYNLSKDSKFVNISTGTFHSASLKSDGTLWTWGNNAFGQLGDSSTVQKNSAVQIGHDTSWMSVALGENHSIGLKSNGTLWAWGANNKGQLGDGTSNISSVPKQIGKDSTWASIAAGSNHCLALKADGSLWAWGENIYGQLGDSSKTDRNRPVQMGKQYKWVSISAGDKHSLGLTSRGKLFAWGNNENYQLGDGSKSQRIKPVQLGGDSTWVAMSAGGGHSLALKADGSLWAWGNNEREQLGDGSSYSRTGPGRIGSENKWISIACGKTHSLGLKSDGTLWAWGDNASGQFKDSTSKSRTGFLQIGYDRDWTKISAGAYHSLGIKAGGQIVWALGNNCYGQLGNDSVSNCNPPPPPAASHQKICSKNSVILAATGLGKLSWYTAATGGNYLGSGAFFTTPILTDSVTYYVQDSTFVPSTSRTAVKVSILALPFLKIIASDSIVCNGESVVLKGYGAKTLAWSGGIKDNISFIPKATTTYVLTGTDSNFCADSISIIIKVDTLPIVTANLIDTAICKGTGLILSGRGANSYLWSGGIKDGVSFFVDSSATYHVTGTDGNNCSNTSSAKIIVKSLPKVIAKSNYDAVCEGYPIILSGFGASNYNWSSGVKNGVSFVPSTTSRFTVTGIAVNDCIDTASIWIIVHPTPSIQVTSPLSFCCDAGNIALGSSKFASPLGGTWTCRENPSLIISNEFQTDLACNQKKPIDVVLKYLFKDTITSCFNSDSTTFAIQPLPNIKTYLNGNILSAEQSGASYQWLDCKQNYLQISGETKQNFAPLKNGDYAVIVTLNKCSDTSACLGINSLSAMKPEIKNVFTIYPNPSNGNIFIKSDYQGFYTILNELGQTLFTFELNGNNNFSTLLTNMSNGIYWVTGMVGNRTYHQKFVVIN